MAKIIVSVLGGLTLIGLIAMLFFSHIFEDGVRNQEKVARLLAAQHQAFESMEHLPWDAEARIISVRSDTAQLTIALDATPPPDTMVVSSVCSYRKLRELVLSDVIVRLVWTPDRRSVTHMTKIDHCLTLR